MILKHSYVPDHVWDIIEMIGQAQAIKNLLFNGEMLRKSSNPRGLRKETSPLLNQILSNFNKFACDCVDQRIKRSLINDSSRCGNGELALRVSIKPKLVNH